MAIRPAVPGVPSSFGGPAAYAAHAEREAAAAAAAAAAADSSSDNEQRGPAQVVVESGDELVQVVDSDSEEIEEVEEAEEADPLRKVVGRWHHPISCDPFSERTTNINSDLNLVDHIFNSVPRRFFGTSLSTLFGCVFGKKPAPNFLLHWPLSGFFHSCICMQLLSCMVESDIFRSGHSSIHWKAMCG